MVWLAFMSWVISQANEREDYTNYFGVGWGFPGIGPQPAFWSLMISLGTVMAPVDVPFSLLMCYNKCVLRFKV